MGAAGPCQRSAPLRRGAAASAGRHRAAHVTPAAQTAGQRRQSTAGAGVRLNIVAVETLIVSDEHEVFCVYLLESNKFLQRQHLMQVRGDESNKEPK